MLSSEVEDVHYMFHVTYTPDPVTIQEALSGPEAFEWTKASEKELANKDASITMLREKENG